MTNVTNDDRANQTGLWLFLVAMIGWGGLAIAMYLMAS